jgi:hypothetical protein
VTRIALALFEGAEELDWAGPWEVLAAWSKMWPDDGVEVYTVAGAAAPVTCAKGLRVLPDHTWETAPPADVLLVPGGRGTRPLARDELALARVRSHAERGALRTLNLMPEWHLVMLALLTLSLLGFVWRPLFLFAPILGLAVAAPLADAAAGVPAASRRRTGSYPKGMRWRLLSMGLNLLQPLARLVGRLQRGACPWGWPSVRTLRWPTPTQFRLWAEKWQEPTARIAGLERALLSRGLTVLTGGEYDGWDLEVPGGIFGSARVACLVEEHGSGRQLLRVRVSPSGLLSPAGLVLGCVAVPAVLAALNGAWIAAGILTLATLLIADLMAQQAAFAVSAVGRAVEEAGGVTAAASDNASGKPTVEVPKAAGHGREAVQF